MLTALDLFPHEASPESGLPIQGRILLRNALWLLTERDVRDFIANGTIKERDDPDQAQRIGSHSL